ncbi:MAG: ubiquitin-like protein Pup [Propionibacteriaceae bacterium]
MAWRKQEEKLVSDQTSDSEETIVRTQPTDLDDILDQIDAVLEVNAEEFVKSFVQKGGE